MYKVIMSFLGGAYPVRQLVDVRCQLSSAEHEVL